MELSKNEINLLRSTLFNIEVKLNEVAKSTLKYRYGNVTNINFDFVFQIDNYSFAYLLFIFENEEVLQNFFTQPELLLFHKVIGVWERVVENESVTNKDGKLVEQFESVVGEVLARNGSRIKRYKRKLKSDSNSRKVVYFNVLPRKELSE